MPVCREQLTFPIAPEEILRRRIDRQQAGSRHGPSPVRPRLSPPSGPWFPTSHFAPVPTPIGAGTKWYPNRSLRNRALTRSWVHNIEDELRDRPTDCKAAPHCCNGAWCSPSCVSVHVYAYTFICKQQRSASASTTRCTLTELARATDSSLQGVLNTGVEACRRQVFLERANDAFAELRRKRCFGVLAIAPSVPFAH